MKMCWPISDSNGLGSVVTKEFSDAGMYLIYDNADDSFKTYVEKELTDLLEADTPLEALQNCGVDAIVTSEVKAAAYKIMKTRGGFEVFRSAGTTVADDIESMNAGSLLEFNNTEILMPSGGCGSSCSSCSSSSCGDSK